MIDLKFSVKCPYCNKTITASCEDYVVDESYDEREMGTEVEYTIACDEYKCPFCNEVFILSGSIWEYPEGCENLNEISSSAIDY